MIRAVAPSAIWYGGGVFWMPGWRRPRRSLLVVAGRIAAFDRPAPPDAERRDLRGRFALPAFCDSHIHLLPLIERASGVDVSDCSTIAQIRDRLRKAPGEGWVRGQGLDEHSLHERRFPTIDEVEAPRPVRLMHRTGHVALLNRAALQALPAAVRARAEASGLLEYEADGSATGIAWEPGQWLSGAALPPLSRPELEAGWAAAATGLFAHGVTAVHDASPRGDAARFDLLRSLPRHIRILQMRGEAWAHTPVGEEIEGWLRMGPTKIVLSDVPGEAPSAAALTDRFRAAGGPVAVHAVVSAAVLASVQAARLCESPVRIEHAAEWPPEAFDDAPGELTVVTHPGWLWERAAIYGREVPREWQPWLHRGQSLLRAGFRVLYGSDFPAGTTNPWAWLQTATTRRGSDGAALNPSERVGVSSALRSAIGGWADVAGAAPFSIGAPADFLLLDDDIRTVPHGRLAKQLPSAVFVDGDCVVGTTD